ERGKCRAQEGGVGNGQARAVRCCARRAEGKNSLERAQSKLIKRRARFFFDSAANLLWTSFAQSGPRQSTAPCTVNFFWAARAMRTAQRCMQPKSRRKSGFIGCLCNSRGAKLRGRQATTGFDCRNLAAGSFAVNAFLD